MSDEHAVPNPDPESVPEAEAAEAPAQTVPFALDALMDVGMPVIVEIGRTSMTLNDVLQLQPGSVVQLDRLVGEPIDLYVSDRKLAEGEVVVVGDHLGVRITRVLSHPVTRAAA